VHVNRRIRAIIENKAGLVGDRVPPSFGTFLLHQDMLERAISGQPYAKEMESVRHFPQDFETDIRDGYTRVLQQMNKDLGQS
jgi:hypothetical protein